MLFLPAVTVVTVVSVAAYMSDLVVVAVVAVSFVVGCSGAVGVEWVVVVVEWVVVAEVVLGLVEELGQTVVVAVSAVVVVGRQPAAEAGGCYLLTCLTTFV